MPSIGQSCCWRKHITLTNFLRYRTTISNTKESDSDCNSHADKPSCSKQVVEIAVTTLLEQKQKYIGF